MKTAVIVIVVVVFGVVAWFVFGKSDSLPSTTTQPTDSTAQQQPADADNDFGSSQTITYNNVGFSPEMLTSKIGEKVIIENKSSEPLQFSSDPHPDHTDNPQLNLSTVEPGGSITFTPTTAGNFGFHNHFNSNHRGRIVVQ